MNALDLIARAQTMPKTHRVVTLYECGKMRTHDTRCAASAENYATGERRKVGREFIDRETGLPVRVVAVETVEI
jgi:hypothetical protein